MRLATKEQIQALDRAMGEAGGMQLPTDLMEEAGRKFVSIAETIYCFRNKRILVLVGPGSNGADAWVISRILCQQYKDQIQVYCVECAAESPEEQQKRSLPWRQLKQSAVTAAQEGSHLQIVPSDQLGKFPSGYFDFCLDGIFGVGNLRPPGEQIIQVMTQARFCCKKFLAIDVPSGLDADTGTSWPTTFDCDVTIAFGFLKPGLLVSQASKKTGKIRLARLSYPASLVRKYLTTHFALGPAGTKSLLPSRASHQHKKHFGTVFVCGGSLTYPGAAVLSARAALRTGAGYVHILSEFPYHEVKDLPEALFSQPQPLRLQAWLSKSGLNYKNQAFVIGPGMTENPYTKKLLLKLAQANLENLVIDAGAVRSYKKIFLKAQKKNSKLRQQTKNWILTPHSGELADLMDVPAATIESDRFGWAFKASQKFQCTVLLKGHHSLICDGKRIVAVLSGNAGLAKAGSGDVLAGIIGSLRAQGCTAFDSALVGASLHGAAADHWKQKYKNEGSITPSDIIESLKWGSSLATRSVSKRNPAG